MLNVTPLPWQTKAVVTHTMREGLVRAGITPGRKQVVEGHLNGQRSAPPSMHTAAPEGKRGVGCLPKGAAGRQTGAVQ